jgi:hypothetical protein
VGFEPTISAGERPQTYALDRSVTGTGEIYLSILCIKIPAYCKIIIEREGTEE